MIPGNQEYLHSRTVTVDKQHQQGSFDEINITKNASRMSRRYADIYLLAILIYKQFFTGNLAIKSLLNALQTRYYSNEL